MVTSRRPRNVLPSPSASSGTEPIPAILSSSATYVGQLGTLLHRPRSASVRNAFCLLGLYQSLSLSPPLCTAIILFSSCLLYSYASQIHVNLVTNETACLSFSRSDLFFTEGRPIRTPGPNLGDSGWATAANIYTANQIVTPCAHGC